ncbi:semaphorin-7A-like [Platysternon megacephalum]|uniref:Semaphorin-7A-like n=1 Tax=Platysternon megacephalum TaxID=55544 RepID=A0A4D9EKA4_9SAUR|nr:semaphorin-7A-like [Platysternon megacephalum]
MRDCFRALHSGGGFIKLTLKEAGFVHKSQLHDRNKMPCSFGYQLKSLGRQVWGNWIPLILQLKHCPFFTLTLLLPACYLAITDVTNGITNGRATVLSTPAAEIQNP